MVIFHSYVKLPEGIRQRHIGWVHGYMFESHIQLNQSLQSFYVIYLCERSLKLLIYIYIYDSIRWFIIHELMWTIDISTINRSYILVLVGGIPTPLKNDGVRQLGWWHSELNGKIKNVPNHQPVYIYIPVQNICIYPNRTFFEDVWSLWLIESAIPT